MLKRMTPLERRDHELQEAKNRHARLMQRHEKAAAQSKLREELQRHTANRNRQMELDRLHEASLRHSGLDVPALNRMRQLQNMITGK